MTKIERKEFPSDDDGEILYRLAKNGIDLSKKRNICFYCYAKNEKDSILISNLMDSMGYRSRIYFDEYEDDYSVYFELYMIPEYSILIDKQKEINFALERYDTYCDGWMTESTPQISV